MKIILIFLFLFFLPGWTNEIFVLERRVEKVDLVLTKTNNSYSLSFNLSLTNDNDNEDGHYYLVSYDELFQVRRIRKYNLDEKVVLNIAFFPDGKIQTLRETILGNVSQEKIFNEAGYLVRDTLRMTRISPLKNTTKSKTKEYTYDEEGNPTIIRYLENGKLISWKKIFFNEFNGIKKTDFYNANNQMYRYKTEEKIPFSATKDYRLTTIFGSLTEGFISFRVGYFTNHLIRREIRWEMNADYDETNFFYNTNGQLIGKTIKNPSRDLVRTFRYEYDPIAKNNHLLFNDDFKRVYLENRKNYWNEELRKGNLNLYNHYQSLVAAYQYSKENNQVVETQYKIFEQNVVATHYKNDKVFKREIYDFLGNKKGEDSYHYYVNNFLRKREFKIAQPLKSRTIIYYYQELPLNKSGYEMCRRGDQVEKVGFDFGKNIFEAIYRQVQFKNLQPSNKPKSFKEKFDDFQNRLTASNGLENDFFSKELFLIEFCRIRKMVVLDSNEEVLAYLRINFTREKKEKRIVFDYYEGSPRFNYLERGKVDFYRENFPNLLEEGSLTGDDFLSSRDQKKEFLTKANDNLPRDKENLSSRIVVNYFDKTILHLAEKSCYQLKTGKKIGEILIRGSDIREQGSGHCLASFR